MNNAVLINYLDVERIEIDFSDIDNLYRAVGAERISTIHTAKTQELSTKLGIHLVGYVDREGNAINNKLACEISGYPYLGSKMVLCKTDDKFNAMPFTEAETDCVYTYLTTGKVVPAVAVSADFFTVHAIKPFLPNFGFDARFVFPADYPDLALAIYDLASADFFRVGEQLFAYSDMLVKRFRKSDGLLLSPDGTYYTKNTWYNARRYFIVGIEAADALTRPHPLNSLDRIVETVFPLD